MEVACDADGLVPWCESSTGFGRYFLLQVKACSKHNISLDFCNPYEKEKQFINIWLS